LFYGRHALKARLNSYDELGEAIETCYEGLKTHMEGETDLDKDIKVNLAVNVLQG
jgi:gamma-tubulin complex component 5